MEHEFIGVSQVQSHPLFDESLGPKYVEACSSGNTEVVEQILRHIWYWDKKDIWYFRGIMVAVVRGHINLFPLLKDTASSRGLVYGQAVAGIIDGNQYAIEAIEVEGGSAF